MRMPPVTSANRRMSSSSSDQKLSRAYFFGFSGFAACFTKVFTRSNSFWNPLVKSCVPYSKRTTKQNVKKTKRANQNRPRSNDIAQIVEQHKCQVNARVLVKVRIEPRGETAKLFAPC